MRRHPLQIESECAAILPKQDEQKKTEGTDDRVLIESSTIGSKMVPVVEPLQFGLDAHAESIRKAKHEFNQLKPRRR